VVIQGFRPYPLQFDREIITFQDGGISAIDWSMTEDDDIDSSAPILIILHGLAGDSDKAHILSVCWEARQRGYRVAVMIGRGCGDLELKTAKVYTAGDTEDFRAVLGRIREKYPRAALYGVGFSLGSNILTRFAGEEGGQCPLNGFVSICNPYDFHEITSDIPLKSKVLHAFISKVVMRKQVKKLKELGCAGKIDITRKVFTAEKPTICENDKEARTRGFRESSCVSYIPNIEIPGLFISAMDDIVCLRKGFPIEKIEHNCNLMMCLTEFGGHLGYFEGLHAHQWHPEVVMDYFDTLERYFNE